MIHDPPAYGLWTLAIVNAAIFIIFAFSFFRPNTPRDWRSFGAFSGFLVALFAEMYGFPLTIYLLSGWLQSRYPGIDWFSHDAGHLLEMLFGWKANPHVGPFHILSFVFIGGGFLLLAAAWQVLYRAQRTGALAATGPYAWVRHPQYVAFVLIMFGFLLQWLTILTLAMFPVLVAMYVALSLREEKEALAEFGEQYRRYMARVPRFVPSLFGRAAPAAVAFAALLAGGPSVAADTSNYREAAGLAIYLGVLPAEIVRGHPRSHPERSMHGGVPSGENVNHIVIAVFDQASGERLKDLTAKASVLNPGHAPREKPLEPMTIADAPSYGNYFSLPRFGEHRIVVEIRRPDAGPVQVQFTHVVHPR